VFTDTIAALWQRLRTKWHAPAEKTQPGKSDDAAAGTLLRNGQQAGLLARQMLHSGVAVEHCEIPLCRTKR
jgi:hypothetical protein